MHKVSQLTAGFALVFAAAATPAFAQAPSHAAPTALPDSAKALVGVWEGNYASDHAPSAPMRLTVARDKDWSAKLEISMGNGGMESVPVRDFTYSSTDISFVIDMMGQPCQATSILKSGALHGTVVCGHGAITYVLSKQTK
jgi:hypothetical protein